MRDGGLVCLEIRGSDPSPGRNSRALAVPLQAEIGIGGSLAAPPLPHHRAYGSVPRRFDRVKRLAVSPIEEGRSRRRKRWIEPAAPPHGEPCASTPTRPRQQRPRGSATHPVGAVAHTESAHSSTVARYTYAIGDESRRRGS